jgi:hypothetical protein
MIEYYNSGFITLRNRKIGLLFSGESAEHIMDNFLTNPGSHPLKHLRIQQLAKHVKEWRKKGAKRFEGLVTDTRTGIRFLVVTEVYSKFAIIITCYKY